MISSHSNALVKRIRKLQQKKYREREGAFFVEGIRIVLTALEKNAAVETLVFAPELLTSDLALAAVDEQRELGRNVVAVTASVFESLSGRDNAVGLGAVIHAGLTPPAELSTANQEIVVALDEISDPGNLGTIIRTVDAAGGAGVILLGNSTDPFHPTALRASVGAVFNVALARMSSPSELIDWARQREMQIVATSARADYSFWQAPYAMPALLLFGSEGEGLSAEVLAEADLAVSIPMYGVSSSLNLAVAAGLLLYELRRRSPIAS